MRQTTIKSQFHSLFKKCWWIAIKNKFSTLWQILFPSLVVLFLAFVFRGVDFEFIFGAKDSTNISLCNSKGCPTVYYFDSSMENGDTTASSVISKLMQASLSSNFGFKKVIPVPNYKRLAKEFIAYQRNITISPSFPPSYFVQFNGIDSSNILNYTILSTEEFRFSILPNENLLRAAWSTLVPQINDIENVRITASHKSSPIPFSIPAKQFFDFTWILLLVGFFPIFSNLSNNIINERKQGVDALLSQWNVYKSIHLLTHAFTGIAIGLVGLLLGFLTFLTVQKKIDIFDSTPAAPIFLTLIAYIVVLVAMALFTGMFFKGAMGVNIVGLILWMQLLVGKYIFYVFGKKAIWAMLIFPLLGVSERYNQIAKLNEFRITNNRFFISILFATALYFFLALLISKGISNIAKFWLSCKRKDFPASHDNINLNHVSMQFKKKVVLKDISIQASLGKLYTLLGRNGAGKSTLMNLMAGALVPTNGDVQIFGYDPSFDRQAITSLVAYCAQENQYWKQLTLGQHIELIASLFEIGNINISQKLAEVGLEDCYHVLADDLSGGMKRRMNLIFCDIRRCKLILLDEPTSGVDYVTQRKIWTFIEKLKKTSLVVLATHIMEEAQILSDHICFMQEGSIVLQGSPTELQRTFGGTHTLKVSVDPSSQEGLLRRTLEDWLSYFPSSHSPQDLSRVAPGSFKVSIPKELLPQVSKLVETASTSLNGFHWHIINNTLDRLFHKYCPIPMYLHTENYINALPEASMTMKPQNEYELPHPKQITYFRIFFNHYLVTMWKNAMLLLRNPVISVTLLIFYLCWIGIPFFFFNIKTSFQQDPVIKISEFLSTPKDTNWTISDISFIDEDLFKLVKTQNQDKNQVENQDLKRFTGCYFDIHSMTKTTLNYTLDTRTMYVAECSELITSRYLSALKNEKATTSMIQLMGLVSIEARWIIERLFQEYINLYYLFGFAIMTMMMAGRFLLTEKLGGLDHFLRLQGLLSKSFWLANLCSHLLLAVFLTVLLQVSCSTGKIKSWFELTDWLAFFFSYAAIAFFFIGISYLLSSFLKSENKYFLASLSVFGISSFFLDWDQEPYVYFSPSGLFRRMTISSIFGDVSSRNTWTPMLVVILYGSALIMIVCLWDETKKGTIDWNWFSSTRSKDDLELNEKEQVDKSTTNEMNSILKGEKTTKDYSVVLKNVTKEFNKKKVVKNVYLGVPFQECLALLGPNGCGKTTLISIITDILRPTTGSVQLSGKKREDFRIGYCPQFGVFWNELTVFEHLKIVATVMGASISECGIWSRQVAKFVGLDDETNLAKYPKQLSGGMRRRLSFAMAIIGSPTLLILDEPTTGVDPVNRKILWDIIEQYQKSASRKHPLSVLLTTHFLEEADLLCQRASIMKEGRLQCIATQSELKQLYGEGFSLIIQIPFEGGLHSNSDLKEWQTIKETSKLQELNEQLKYILGISSGPLSLYQANGMCRRRQVICNDPSNNLHVSWILSVRFTIGMEVFLPKHLAKILTLLETQGILEWSFGMVELEEVFVNVICGSEVKK